MRAVPSVVEPSLTNLEKWMAISGGSLLLLFGVTRRSVPGLGVALASGPLLYRGVTGRWPAFLAPNGASDDTKVALSGDRGTNVRDSILVNRPVDEVYRFWRQLGNLPDFTSHLESVTEEAPGLSHWVAIGPAGLRVEWDAEIINEIENELIAWRSLPGSEIVSAGSVNFDPAFGGASTWVMVNFQYAAPAGHAGDLIASLFRRAPSQMIREDLRRFKTLMEEMRASSSAHQRPLV